MKRPFLSKDIEQFPYVISHIFLRILSNFLIDCSARESFYHNSIILFSEYSSKNIAKRENLENLSTYHIVKKKC